MALSTLISLSLDQVASFKSQMITQMGKHSMSNKTAHKASVHLEQLLISITAQQDSA